MQLPREEVILPYPVERHRVPSVRRVRSGLLCSSIQSLRARGLFDEYFAKMGLQVRYFMPRGGVAPLAFYFRGDLLGDYTDLQLIGTISTMEDYKSCQIVEIR